MELRISFSQNIIVGSRNYETIMHKSESVVTFKDGELHDTPIKLNDLNHGLIVFKDNYAHLCT